MFILQNATAAFEAPEIYGDDTIFEGKSVPFMAFVVILALVGIVLGLKGCKIWMEDVEIATTEATVTPAKQPLTAKISGFNPLYKDPSIEHIVGSSVPEKLPFYEEEEFYPQVIRN
ncbi:Oidioi.mRNA.OKI2018_I69.PAR.g10513.t1.cds [Oikopleura dioica]|uniref:Oidioi.mRNA.OKI2018_I69.PAR.g10513.t1.cds n=1 Tax=Oikopleura dioica TaxID=34765 RepID=A0ABN7RYK5_OIKDI|nr:Oidioi.mRNA.OKI2018_I69.PAR.g10513.t1.cds [Oikopleura dioica]